MKRKGDKKYNAIDNFKHNEISLAAILLALLLLLPACTRQRQPARVEAITFQSGKFKLVGDLHTAAGTAPFPVVLFVHGDAPGANCTFFGMDLPIMERLLRAGNAVFSWDNPGASGSTGTSNRGQFTQQQAQISCSKGKSNASAIARQKLS